MKFRPDPMAKPLCPILRLATTYGPVGCQEARCAWYSPLHGCAINALTALEDIAATKEARE